MLFATLASLSMMATAVMAAPKILICSDSTTANYKESDALQGWGYYLGEYMSVKVINLAKNGRSTRSFIREGLWRTLLSQTQPGDFVIIEMGHNDGNDPSKNSDPERASRGVLRGIGNNTVQGPAGKNGGKETVHTFGWYLRQMVHDVQAKKAIPLLSGMVPTNTFRGGKFRTDWPMASDTAAVAKQEGVEYIDHTKYSAARFQALGEVAVKRFFPRDSTHTNSAGARVNAETFVTALKCARSKAATYIGTKGQALSQKC